MELRKISIRESTYEMIIRTKGFLSMKEGENISIAEVVERAILQFNPGPIDLDDDELFHIREPSQRHEEVLPRDRKKVQKVQEEGGGQE